uniref:Retrovirus-related Pol polyprotein from transposon TNT 1-94 n=1 Tax=Nelumbo nucifera TaxID=4432 RepID=A0A822ZG07_NELNU|nr:TPA_asm: hypothetical protein HUJ06_016299 [Nelumbo nucifera]
MDDVIVIEKILRSMTPKFDYVVCSIEESNEIDYLSIDELQSNLFVHEQRIIGHVMEEQVLKVSQENNSPSRGRGRGSYREQGNIANFAEAKEEMLLMAYVTMQEDTVDKL